VSHWQRQSSNWRRYTRSRKVTQQSATIFYSSPIHGALSTNKLFSTQCTAWPGLQCTLLANSQDGHSTTLLVVLQEPEAWRSLERLCCHIVNSCLVYALLLMQQLLANVQATKHSMPDHLTPGTEREQTHQHHTEMRCCTSTAQQCTRMLFQCTTMLQPLAK
jgi:hypothetical protein